MDFQPVKRCVIDQIGQAQPWAPRKMERTVVPPHLARCRNSSTCDLLLATLEPLRLMGCTTLLSRWAEQAGRTACIYEMGAR